VGLLDAFDGTWSQARETFGQGTPEDGAKFDGSSRLLQMKSSVEAAAPDSRWQGSASEAYAAANKGHAQVYGKLADLDRRMAAEVTNAANVVSTGRQNLDSVKSWVTSMAASIPDTDAEERDRKLLPIVNKGVGQLSDIIQKSTGEMTDIRGRVQGIKGEYEDLIRQKFGPDRQTPGDGNDGDKKQSDPTQSDAPGAKPGEPGGPEFVIGPPTKPDIKWDEDFKYDSADPSWRDYLKRAEWQAKLAGGRVLRPDLDDATQMYRHYWDNDGKPIEFDYEEAYREDPGIKANVDDQISRAQRGAEDLIRAGNTSFSMTGDATPTSTYPTTENWQKAVGGYQQWSSADVRVDGNKVTMTVTVHAEDHYNFNRGQADIGTGAADNENGRFTELGWAKPFDSHGQITRTITWELGSAPSTEQGGHPQFNPGREDRVDGRGSPGGIGRPENNRNTGGVTLP
jgi:hypothetical protein